MSAELFIGCLDRSDCEMLRPAMAHACTTFATALLWKHWCAGIARMRTSNDACPSYRPISVMRMSLIPTGISPARRNYSEPQESEWRKGGEVFYEKTY